MKKIICLIVCMLLLSGCAVKGEINMGVNSDKSINFSVMAAYDEELIEALMSMNGESESENYTDEQIWEFLESQTSEEDGKNPEELGFTVSHYEKDDFKGFIYTKTISNIDDLVSEDANFNIIENYLEISESKLFTKEGNNYVSKITYSEASDDIDTYNIDQEMIFTLTLPNKTITNNATTVSEDGKTLTWDLSDITSGGNIEFTFNFPTFPIVPVVIGIIALIGICAALAIIFGKGKKKNNNVGNNSIFNDTNVINTSNPANNDSQNNDLNINTVSNEQQEKMVTSDNEINQEFEINNEPVNMDMNILADNKDVVENTNEEEIKMFSFDTNIDSSQDEKEANDNKISTENEEVKIFSFDTLSTNQPTENTTNNNQKSNLQ